MPPAHVTPLLAARREHEVSKASELLLNVELTEKDCDKSEERGGHAITDIHVWVSNVANVCTSRQQSRSFQIKILK